MCKPPKIKVPEAPKIAAPVNEEAVREGEMERALRRRRAGAAGDILTSPLGVV
jgi:hypothetical protein